MVAGIPASTKNGLERCADGRDRIGQQSGSLGMLGIALGRITKPTLLKGESPNLDERDSAAVLQEFLTMLDEPHHRQVHAVVVEVPGIDDAARRNGWKADGR